MSGPNVPKPVIVVFPGFALSAISYKRCLLPLRQAGYEVRIFSPSLPLSGDVYSAFRSNRNSMTAGLELMPGQRWIAIGISFGGIIATDCAVHAQKRPERLILIDSGGLPVRRTFLSWGRLFMAQLFNTAKRPGGWLVASRLVCGTFVTTMLHPRTTWRAARISAEFDMGPLAEEVFIPTEIIWGGDDKLAPVSTAYEISKCFVDSRVQVIDDDHNWIHFRSERLIPLLERAHADI